ncbi:winged helix-turn-helix domain-containing protein [Streptomyces sp. NPDC002599]|uniref:winged helix-turn-helix domain-containing protein n=1 Tax=Streptomyces sp. NPDC002599 TaxID=3154421 RepID=UPI00331A78DD
MAAAAAGRRAEGCYARGFEQGIKPLDVARRLRVGEKSAYQWHESWRDSGAGALNSRGPSGSRRRPSPCCPEEPTAYPEQGPAAHGWVENWAWTAARAALLIGGKSHVSCSASGTTRLTPRLGFSPQVPVRRVTEQAVTTWKEATWDEVKESGRTAGATSASRTRRTLSVGRPRGVAGADTA